MTESSKTNVGQRMKALRKKRGITQASLAAALGIGQTALSHAEQREDALFSTLEAYVSGLGGCLNIQACFADGTVNLIDPHAAVGASVEAFEHDPAQLALPGLEPNDRQPERDIVLSIHPSHSANILDGKKTVELRRRFTTAVRRGTRAFIYTTSPTRAFTGSAAIEGVVRLPLSELWRRYRTEACLARRDFDAYFSGREEGYAIVLSRAAPMRRPIGLSELRENYGFAPPQSYSYASGMLRSMLVDGH